MSSLVIICCASAARSSLSPVHVANGTFVDANGRARFFRGVNVVYKDWPWIPHAVEFHSNLSFVDADAKLLASVGVNLIRLGVMWPGVQPSSGATHDAAYIERVRTMVKLAARHGIYCMLEPHQDEFNPRFCGEGVPDWWVESHGAHAAVGDFPIPVQSTPFALNRTAPNFPGRLACDSHSSFSYIWTHSGARAYQSLWDESIAFERFWHTVAAKLGSEENVIGGELWNEPFPGDVFADSRNRDNAFADRHNLQPFYENVTRAIRTAQPNHTNFAIAYEPSWPVGDQDIHPHSMLPSRSGFSKLPELDAIYAFHWYSPPADENLTRYLEARIADAQRLRAVPYASEWNFGAGSSASSVSFAANVAAFEEQKIAYTGWQYKSFSGSLPNGTCTGCGNSFFWTNGSLNSWTMVGLKAPFAQSVTGTDITIRSSTTGEEGPTTYSYELSYTVVGGAVLETSIVVSALFAPGAAFNVVASRGRVKRVEHKAETIEGWQPRVVIPAWTMLTIVHTAKDVGKAVRVTIKADN